MKFDKEGKSEPKQVEKIRDNKIVAPDGFRARMGCLLRANHDLVAKSDKELGQTHMVK